MNILSGREVPTQLHVSPEAWELSRGGFINPLSNMPACRAVESLSKKPLSALWTCDLIDGSSAWVEFLNTNRDIIPERRFPEASWWHEIHVKHDASVVLIRNLDDYCELTELMGRERYDPLSTRFLASRFDGLRIEKRAVEQLRKRQIDFDIPSTAWFRWSFKRVECVATPSRKQVA